MISVTVAEHARALELLDPTKREAILSSAKEAPEDPLTPPNLLEMWPGQREYNSAFGKLDQLTPDARKALNTLPDFLSVPLLLQLQGRTQDEIAAELGTTKAAVNGRQKRAKQAIQRQLWTGRSGRGRSGVFSGWCRGRGSALTDDERRAIEKLPLAKQTALLLHLQGKKTREIAREMRTTEQIVRRLVTNARYAAQRSVNRSMAVVPQERQT